MIDRGIYRVEVETNPWIQEDGVLVATYIGEGACEPVLEYVTSYSELIDQTLESYVLPSTGKIAESHVDEVMDLLQALRSAVAYAEITATKLMPDSDDE